MTLCDKVHWLVAVRANSLEMPHHSKRWLATLGVLIVTMLAIWNYTAAKTTARWFLWSRDYKSKVLSQQSSFNGELKHIEWDGWGWAGMNTAVYLVFDPADSLSATAKSHLSGRLNGVPCEVFRVRRLESQWYTAQFYTGEDWNSCKLKMQEARPD